MLTHRCFLCLGVFLAILFNSKANAQLQANVAILGAKGAGKATLLHKLISAKNQRTKIPHEFLLGDDTFKDHFYFYNLEQMNSAPDCYSQYDFILVVFAHNNKASFEYAAQVINALSRASLPSTVIKLVGTKADRPRLVDTRPYWAAQKFGISFHDFFGVHDLRSDVDEIFEEIVQNWASMRADAFTDHRLTIVDPGSESLSKS